MHQKIRLAILECDTPIPSVDEKYHGYGGVFKALFNAAAKSEIHASAEDVFDFSVYQVVENPGTYPELQNIDAVLLTGSKHDSFADTPWITQLVEYVQTVLDQQRVRLVGICFGHQIIARALGVKVGRNPGGWEAAVHDVTLTPRGKEILGLETLKIHQMHRDAVLEFPKGLESLGHSPVCQTQGFYESKRLLSVQGHPEFTGEITREIIEVRHSTGVFDEEAYRTHIKKVDLPHDGIATGKAIIRFLCD